MLDVSGGFGRDVLGIEISLSGSAVGMTGWSGRGELGYALLFGSRTSQRFVAGVVASGVSWLAIVELSYKVSKGSSGESRG